MSGPPDAVDSYLICATPRTGSTLLCGMLASTGVAGHPESYFREEGEQSMAAQWGILDPANGTFRYSDFVQAAIRAGTTGNGVFAARIMWESLDRLVANMGRIHPDLAGRAIDLLNRAFGRTGFVYLRRDDVVAQAVSLLRAEQTKVWHEASGEPRSEPEQQPRFDFDQIHELAGEIEDHNAAWREWFDLVGIRPHLVRYEDLEADPVGIARGVLDFLGLAVPAGREIEVRNRRLADEINTQWIGCYRARARRP